MSTTQQATTQPSDHSDGAEASPAPELFQVDPRLLLRDANVRVDTSIDADFIASIKEFGVLVPIVAVWTAERELRVRFGHRRVAAAIKTGQNTIPVMVAADEGTDDAAQVERLLTQWAENEHRDGLNTADKLHAVAQLTAFGVSEAQIARRTRMPRATVKAVVAVTRSELASAAATRYDFLDLIQAAVVAEFEGDTDAIKELVATAQTRPGQFDHTAQRLRDQRDEAHRLSTAQEALRATGVTVIDRPGYNDTPAALGRLTTPEGEQLDQANHAECPGHAAYLSLRNGYVDPTTGQPVDDYDDDEGDDQGDDEGDDQGDDQGDEKAADHAAEDERPTPVWGSYLDTEWVCTDPAEHGHVDRWATRTSSAPRTPVAEMDEVEREAARAARRDVIDSNKAWASAEKVRRAWLRTFVARKTPPKGTAAFVATAISQDPDMFDSVRGKNLAASLVGCEPSVYGRATALGALIDQASEARANVLTLAQVLAAYEDSTDRANWRHQSQPVTRYLQFLRANGYDLSPVELRAIGEQLNTDTDTGTDPDGQDDPDAQADTGDTGDTDAEQADQADDAAPQGEAA